MNINLRTCTAEFIGTFALVLIGAGSVVVNDVTGGAITHLGISFAFGGIVLAMIYTVGDVSGAHLNPAVTLGFFAARRFPAAAVLPYVVCQLAGAVVASVLLTVWFPTHETYGATIPSGSLWQSFSMEVVLTFLLMFVILSVSTGAKEKGLMAGVAIGATVALGALFGGPVSGASMNPARSFGPALVSGDLSVLWLYVAAPVCGAGLAVLTCVCTRDKACCGPAAESSAETDV